MPSVQSSTWRNWRKNKSPLSTVYLVTIFHMFYNLKRSSENQEIIYTTSFSEQLRPQYSRELLIHLRSSPSAKEVPAAARDIGLLVLKRRFRGRRGGWHQHHKMQRQPTALPASVPVLMDQAVASGLLRTMNYTGRIYSRFAVTPITALISHLHPVSLLSDSLPQCPYKASTDSVYDTRPVYQTPGLYIFNVRSIAKPSYVKYQLLAKMTRALQPWHGRNHRVPSKVPSSGAYSSLRIEGFRLFCRDWLVRRCGGVAILEDNRYRATEINIDGDIRTLELLWVRIVIAKRSFFLSAVYHPPKPTYEVNVQLTRLERTVEERANVDPEALIILGGDFNGLRRVVLLRSRD